MENIRLVLQRIQYLIVRREKQVQHIRVIIIRQIIVVDHVQHENIVQPDHVEQHVQHEHIVRHEQAVVLSVHVEVIVQHE